MAAFDRPGDAPDGTPGSTKRPRITRSVAELDAPSGGGTSPGKARTRAQLLRGRAQARHDLAPELDEPGDDADAPLDDSGPITFAGTTSPLLDAWTAGAIGSAGGTSSPRSANGNGSGDHAGSAAFYDEDRAVPDIARGVATTGPVTTLPHDERDQPTAAMPSVLDVPDARTIEVTNPTPPSTPIPLVVRPAEVPPPPLPQTKQQRQRTTTVLRRKPKARVRRVRRVVRSIDAWSVFKLSVLFYLVLYAVLLVAGVLLWNLAYATGTIDNLERFFESFGWETFEFHGGEIFHSMWIAGLFLVAAGTGLNVVLATVFNLIADLVGGVGVTVLEEEVRVVPDVLVGGRRGRDGLDVDD